MYYTYDSLGRQTGYKLSASSSSAAEGLSEVSYSFDDYGRFHSVSSSVNSVSSVVNYSYLENSSLISSITNNLGFGISKYYEDNRNLIVGVSNYFGTNCISSFEYQNDALGRRSQRVDNNIDYSVAITNSFAYNGYSEVTNAIMNTDNYNYTFDDIGNRTQSVIPNNQTNTSVDYENSQLNQCLEANSSNPAYDKSFAFDFDGNMITNNVWAYTWNAENRMVSATNYVDNTYITYAYDYQGRMIKKVTDGETTLFYWNGVQIIAEISTDTATCVSNYYTWANGETICADLDGETVFYCHDANKNVTDLVDDSGDLVAHYEYSPFGVRTTTDEQPSTETNPFGFSNEYFDETTGLVEFWRRKYFPPLGKFASRDPIGIQGGPNEYGICGNDLINKVDINGLWPGWTLCEDAGEDDVWVDADWKDIGYVPTSKIGGSGGYLTDGVAFRWIRKFKRKYICSNCEEKWSEGINGYIHRQKGYIVYLDGTTFPPSGMDIANLWSLIVDAAGNAIPFNGQPADLSYDIKPYPGKEPNQNTVGRIVKSPKTPYTVHL